MSFNYVYVFEQFNEIGRVFSTRLDRIYIQAALALWLAVFVFQYRSVFARIPYLAFIYIEAVFVILLRRGDYDSFILLDLQIVLVPYYLNIIAFMCN